MTQAKHFFLPLCAVLLLATGFADVVENPALPAADRVSIYEARGVLQSFDAQTRQATIRHEAIAGYMPAMTMSFEVRDAGELSGLSPGVVLTFHLCVTADRAWIEQLRKTDAALVPVVPVTPLLAPASPGTSPELNIGDLLPDIGLIDQTGEKIHLRDFRGKVLAITFIYTRCPLPTYCPLISRNFQTAQTLLTRLGVGEDWHLLSISLDTENDTPDTLAFYARNYQADARRWTFACASADAVRKLGDAVGLVFKSEEGRIDHNLRTVVVDAGGRIRRLFRGNTWTAQELAAEIRTDARDHH